MVLTLVLRSRTLLLLSVAHWMLRVRTCFRANSRVKKKVFKNPETTTNAFFHGDRCTQSAKKEEEKAFAHITLAGLSH